MTKNVKDIGILRRIVFERGVPLSLRSDNAPELMKGLVKTNICAYLNIQQIVTGGHNPRGNASCERANQTVGNMIRKLSDNISICYDEHHISFLHRLFPI